MKSSVMWVRRLLLVTAITISSPAFADFSGPYAITPPAPGRYNNPGLSSPFGNWLATTVSGVVDTEEAPSRLQLESPSFGFFPMVLRFEAQAAASGTVSFDYTTVSRYVPNGGAISWMWQPVGGARIHIPLDLGLNNQLRHFDFPVQVGDQFGFRLISGADVINPGEPLLLILTVENFFAPVPEASTSAMIVIGGCLLFASRRLCRRTADSCSPTPPCYETLQT